MSASCGDLLLRACLIVGDLLLHARLIADCMHQEGLMAHGWRYFCLLSLHASGWGPPKFGRAPQIESFKLVCVLIGNKKISRDAKGLFFRFLISKESRRLYKQGVLHLKDELLKKRGVMSWAVGGLMGRLVRPIMVRFRD